MKRRSENYGKFEGNSFALREDNNPTHEAISKIHVLGDGIICDTESRGHETPQGRSPFEIVVDASEGFIPLWANNTTLRWRFQERSLTHFANPNAAESATRQLFGEAIMAWGSAAPVKFTEDDDVWDFEIVVRQGDECTPSGCVLARAFFPDSGRHELVIYPKMFTQSRQEQIETLIHEIGHIFGLRHFFAKVSELSWPSEIFGTHDKFSIMNYGALSVLTANDTNDLKRLYQSAWSGILTTINGTPIRLVKPFHTLADPDGVFAFKPQPPPQSEMKLILSTLLHEYRTSQTDRL